MRDCLKRHNSLSLVQLGASSLATERGLIRALPVEALSLTRSPKRGGQARGAGSYTGGSSTLRTARTAGGKTSPVAVHGLP